MFGRVGGMSDCSPGDSTWPPHQPWPPLGFYQCSSQSLEKGSIKKKSPVSISEHFAMYQADRDYNIIKGEVHQHTHTHQGSSSPMCECQCCPWQLPCSCRRLGRECPQISPILITQCHTFNNWHSGSNGAKEKDVSFTENLSCQTHGQNNKGNMKRQKSKERVKSNRFNWTVKTRADLYVCVMG